MTNGTEDGEQFTPLQEAAAHVHEMFEALCGAGFDHWTAAYIVALTMVEANRYD